MGIFFSFFSSLLSGSKTHFLWLAYLKSSNISTIVRLKKLFNTFPKFYWVTFFCGWKKEFIPSVHIGMFNGKILWQIIMTEVSHVDSITFTFLLNSSPSSVIVGVLNKLYSLHMSIFALFCCFHGLYYNPFIVQLMHFNELLHVSLEHFWPF